MKINQICLILLSLLLLITQAYASDTYVNSYRLSENPTPSQDFILFVTLKNTTNQTIDNLSIDLNCPLEFKCTDINTTLPPNGLHEISIPIQSTAKSGIYIINFNWQDGTGNYRLDENAHLNLVEETYTETIPIEVKESFITNASITNKAIQNENNIFNLLITAKNIHQAQISLYSTCISFENSIQYFSSIDGNISIPINGYVNCKQGNTEITLTIISSEVSFSSPLNIYIEKKAKANIQIIPLQTELNTGKSYYKVKVTNSGVAAEKLYLKVTNTALINSSTVEFLGDFVGEKEVVFQIENSNSGKANIQIESNWIEGKESFSQTNNSEINFTNNEGIIIGLITAIILLVVGWILFKNGFLKINKA